MTHLGSFVMPAALPVQATFGRDGAMFESLLGFVAQLSLVLWSLVTFTVVIRFVGIRFYRRAARKALARLASADDSVPTAAGRAVAVPGAGVAGTTAAAAAPAVKPAAKSAVPAVVLPAIAVVPVIRAGIDLLQPASVPLPEAVTNVLAGNPADG
ncbi:hypothetical protein QF031_000891 [Pseudarthrobacter defluvii]|uniref:hypothetical protein n=1 Tax=Pseudarthrobacter defluvii TaxID=410837 RepID=UPI00277E18E2|nr:hypothetical protein [Pseudarthrobacter defluvii]MDQ0768142.1 hypothetical protein [Pseudarthrobacter defluvii]